MYALLRHERLGLAVDLANGSHAIQLSCDIAHCLPGQHLTDCMVGERAPEAKETDQFAAAESCPDINLWTALR